MRETTFGALALNAHFYTSLASDAVWNKTGEQRARPLWIKTGVAKARPTKAKLEIRFSDDEVVWQD